MKILSQKALVKIRLHTSVKIALIASLVGFISAIIIKEKYLLIISLINLLISFYTYITLR